MTGTVAEQLARKQAKEARDAAEAKESADPLTQRIGLGLPLSNIYATYFGKIDTLLYWAELTGAIRRVVEAGVPGRLGFGRIHPPATAGNQPGRYRGMKSCSILLHIFKRAS